MRIYTNWELAYSEIKRDVYNNSVELQSNRVQDMDVKNDPDFMMREVIAYLYCLDGVRSADVQKSLSVDQKIYCQMEFNERIDETCLNPGESWHALEPLWKPFLHEGRFSYTYHERIGDQVRVMIDLLNFDPNTRQAFVSIWDRSIDKNAVGRVRVPCSLGYLFVKRQGKLDVTYIMRSQDVMTFMPIDVFLALKLQEYVASRVNAKPGRFIHFMNSMHGFRKDLKDHF